VCYSCLIEELQALRLDVDLCNLLEGISFNSFPLIFFSFAFNFPSSVPCIPMSVLPEVTLYTAGPLPRLCRFANPIELYSKTKKQLKPDEWQGLGCGVRSAVYTEMECV
jgi:hypothetical protein